MSVYINIFPLILVILATSLFVIGFTIFQKDTKAGLNRIFALSCLLLTIMYCLSTGLWWVDQPLIAYYVYRIAIILIMLYFGIIPIFYLTFTNMKVSLPLRIAWLVPVAVLSVSIFIFEGVHYEPVKKTYWALNYTFNVFSWIFIIYTNSSPIIGAFIMRRWVKRSPLAKDKIQGKIIFWSLIITTGISFYFDFFQQLLGHHYIPVWPFSNICYVYGVFYCLIRYKFMIFDINTLANEILFHVEGFVFITDQNGNIMRTNNNFVKRTGANLYKNLFDLFDKHDNTIGRLHALFDNTAREFEDRTRLKIGRDVIIADIHCSRMIDRTGDFFGVLVIAREIHGIQDFRRVYNITDRQFGIIDMVIRGTTNMEISEKLGLGRRTVETHINNIYIKLHVRNRMELMKIARKFNLA
jgi:DNA-binding CsgD family transcriptional regulator